MSLTVTGRNKAVDALTPTNMTVHSANPGAGGDNQIGTPQSCTFGAASNGVRALTNQPEFSIPAGTTVAWVVVRDSADDVIAIDELGTPETYSNEGVHRITAGSITIN